MGLICQAGVREHHGVENDGDSSRMLGTYLRRIYLPPGNQQ